MNYITNCMPAVLLSRLHGCTARFSTHNLTRDTWNRIPFGKDIDIAVTWSGNCNHIVNPLMAMGYHCHPFNQLATVDFKSGDTVILIDSESGDTYEWCIC